MDDTQKATDVAPPKPELPASLSELDLTRLQLAMERTARAKAELQLAQESSDRARSSRMNIESELTARYQIGPHDSVDPASGRIIRSGGMLRPKLVDTPTPT